MLQALSHALNASVLYLGLDGRSTQAREAGYAVCELPEGKAMSCSSLSPFPGPWAPVGTAPAPLGLRPSLQRPAPTQQMGAPGGHTWPQDLDSVPGPAWALGSWVKPGLLQTPAESRV